MGLLCPHLHTPPVGPKDGRVQKSNKILCLISDENPRRTVTFMSSIVGPKDIIDYLRSIRSEGGSVL